MVTIYSKNNCVQCKMTKRFLDTNHVEYREINLDEQPEYIDHVKSLGFNAAPVVQTPTEAFSGFQPGKLKNYHKIVVIIELSSRFYKP
ncbi:Glutaredoxin-like protein NrdH, required for reduction of Ribonucleotide reductase class Ib [Streptococcus constellatus]|nr:Glutaredoxin-like protein NrdH, required for reduction of Ribonucleotide reductase class Ib [Streptococcus constellatus]